MRSHEEIFPLSPDGIPHMITQTLTQQGIAFGAFEQKWFVRGKLDSVLKDVDQEEGMEVSPLSNVLLHIFPNEPIHDFNIYHNFAEQVTQAIDDLYPDTPDVFTGTEILPTCTYGEDGQPTTLHLANIDLMHQPLPALVAMGTVIVYPSRETALKYIALLEERQNEYTNLDQWEPLDFPIPWSALDNFQPPTERIEYKEQEPEDFHLHMGHLFIALTKWAAGWAGRRLVDWSNS